MIIDVRLFETYSPEVEEVESEDIVYNCISRHFESSSVDYVSEPDYPEAVESYEIVFEDIPIDCVLIY